MILLGPSDADIRRAAEFLKQGRLVAFPTETVYGLGADAFNTQALARVFEAKGRPRFDPLIIHIAESRALDRIVRLEALDGEKRTLLDKLTASFWPGPLTLILPKRDRVPDLATAGLSTAAVRLPAHPIARALISLSTGAIAAPSANPFGRLSPTRAEHVIETLGDRIDCVIDGGQSTVGVESTVLDLSASGPPRILRYGGISREALEAAIGKVEAPDGDSEDAAAESGGSPRNAESAERSPGMLKGHYAPGVPLILHGQEALPPYSAGDAYLFFSGKSRDAWLTRNPRADNTAVFTLSETGAAVEAAAHLFERLHALDRLKPVHIRAETLPPEGLGAAVNDRLRRASAGSG
jgi:L-threonylcarbamoyladenylate synthase